MAADGSVIDPQEQMAETQDPNQNGHRRRLAGNVLSLYILTGLYYLIPLITLPYLIRVLGIAMYGAVAFSQSFAQYFTTFTDYGFNFSATRSIAQLRGDRAAISRVFCSVYVIKGALVLIGALILLLVVILLPRFRVERNLFFAAYAAVVGNALFPVWFFQGIERMRYISIIVGITRLLSAGLLFVFVRTSNDALAAVAIQSAGALIAGIIGFVIAIRAASLELKAPSVNEIRTSLIEGWSLFISSASMGLYTNTNVFLVGALAGNTQAGYFAAGERLLRGMQALIGPIIQATFPHVNKLGAQSRELAIRFAERSILWVGGATLIPSIILLCFANQITLLCFGQNALGSVAVVRWISFLPILSTLSNLLGVNLMIPLGLDKDFSRIVLVAGVANLVTSFIAVPYLGAIGGGVSILFAEIVVVVGIVSSLRRNECGVFSNRTLVVD